MICIKIRFIFLFFEEHFKKWINVPACIWQSLAFDQSHVDELNLL